MTLKQLTFRLKKKSAGRNSSGRITVFHRGGGSKRLHRKIDFQRSTSSIGLVQRIDYDPNRSSWIALIRWLEAMEQPKAHHNGPQLWRSSSETFSTRPPSLVVDK
jgi:ribosomal protein L2